MGGAFVRPFAPLSLCAFELERRAYGALISRIAFITSP